LRDRRRSQMHEDVGRVRVRDTRARLRRSPVAMVPCPMGSAGPREPSGRL